jgi:hypothetical protein
MGIDTTTNTGSELITLEQVEEVLLHGGVFQPVSEEEVQRDMVARILASNTIEEAFDTFQSTPLDAIIGSPVSVDGVAWMKSAFEQGPAVYALLQVTLRADHVGTGKKGDKLTVSMGGATTMAAFVWAQRHAKMPFVGAFTRERSRTNPERSFIVFKLA